VKEQHPDNPEVNAEEVRKAMDMMKLMDYLKGNSALGGQKQEVGTHKFWKTQPVPQLGEGTPQEDGAIEPSQPPEEVRQDPYSLPGDFEWSTLDISKSTEAREVYELLSQNYVEDPQASFRFQYSAEFLKWALMPPGYHKEWHIGVRVKSNKKLVAFISGVPIHLRVRANLLEASEINYLCIHKKLRSKRLAPVLIKEVTRQCHLKGVFQAIYTAGVLLPTPVSTCRYFHRSLNIPKLVDVKFTYVARNSTLARMVRAHKVPSEPALKSQGLREMEDKDVEAVAGLVERYMKRFKMVPEFKVDEVRHNFLSGRGEGELLNGRREGQVVWSYVAEDPKTHKITDLFSFYSLPSTIMQHPKHALLEAAYLFYYATETAFEEGAESSGRLKRRLLDLIGDALVIANEAKFDVFNALTLMDNHLVLGDLKFGQGDGLLNFYLYNWRTSPLEGNQALTAEQGGGQGIGRGVGVVML